MAVGAEFVACLDGQPTGYIPFIDFSLPCKGRRGLVKFKTSYCADRGRFSLPRRPLAQGGIVAAATAWRSSSKQFWVF
jgi:hypothetical protein